MNTTLDSIRSIVASPEQYTTRLARNLDEVRAAQTPRFEVFNLELNEGLAESFTTGRDENSFDAVCVPHLINFLSK